MKRFRWMGTCAVLFLACSDNSGTNDAGVDSGPDVAPKKDSGPADVAADVPQDTGSTACNALVAPDAAVAEMYVATAPEVGDGGPLVPGTYVITGHTIYTGVEGGAGPTGTSFDGLFVADDAGSYEALQIVTTDGGTPKVTDLNGPAPIVFDGGATWKVNCPVNATLIYSSYSSDGTNFTLYAPTYKPPQSLSLKRQ